MGGALICRNAQSVISKTVSQLDYAAAALSFEQLDTVCVCLIPDRLNGIVRSDFRESADEEIDNKHLTDFWRFASKNVDQTRRLKKEETYHDHQTKLSKTQRSGCRRGDVLWLWHGAQGRRATISAEVAGERQW